MNTDQPPKDKSPFKDTPPRQETPLGNAPLSEENFIQNKPILSSIPFWAWLFLLAAVGAIVLGSRGWYEGFLQKEKSKEPFLEVTNREFSAFLWQFPSYIRSNVSSKTGYLPGFFTDRENMTIQNAEDYVSAPPDLLFLYHTWNRLLSNDLIVRSISPTDFTQFLEKLPEWQPQNWKQAPQDYVKMITSKSYLQTENLQALPLTTLPLLVRHAFQGWKNYFDEGPQINALRPTVGEVQKFIEQYPTYARNYWRNIDEVAGQPVAGSNYLKLLLVGKPPAEEKIPADELSAFLKAALYNAGQAAGKAAQK